jgi:hypothetical protein
MSQAQPQVKAAPQFKSSEELYFSWWLQELQENGFIECWEFEPVQTELLPEVVYVNHVNYEKRKQPAVKLVDKTLFQNVEYTTDFIITWNRELIDLTKFNKMMFQKEQTVLYQSNFGLVIDENYTSYIDIKGSFAGKNNNSAITFPIKQKLMWDKQKVYVQKIIPVDKPKSLFNTTFYPLRYFKVDSGNSARRKKYKGALVELHQIPGVKKLGDFLLTNNTTDICSQEST